MSSYRTLKEADIRSALIGKSFHVSPLFTDGSLRELKLQHGDDHLIVKLESYSITVQAPKLVERYRATLTHNAGVLPTITQDFESEEARDKFVDSLTYDITSQFTLAVSSFEVPA